GDGVRIFAVLAIIRAALAGRRSPVMVGRGLKGFVGTRFAGAEWYVEKIEQRKGNHRVYALVPVESQATL
ncbi:MAG: hypothetical protein O0Y03_06945, partial [Methanocorpusculum sp.]|nr:hypothetical protein [Methanocorpusculum sp.]